MAKSAVSENKELTEDESPVPTGHWPDMARHHKTKLTVAMLRGLLWRREETGANTG